MEFSSLKNNIILECEKTEDKLMHTWYPNIINIFADKNAFTGIKADKQESFYNCVTTLISNQVCDLLQIRMFFFFFFKQKTAYEMIW